MGFSDIFPTATAELEANHIKRKELQTKLDESATIMTADLFEDDLKALKAQLDSRNIKLGKLIGAGALALVFELEDHKGKRIESAVIRIDPTDMTSTIDSPASIKPVFQEVAGSYTASIVPRAVSSSKAEDLKEIDKTLAVFNTGEKMAIVDGKEQTLSQLKFLTDLSPGQFMELPGMPIPVLADFSSMSSTPISKDGPRLGANIENYMENYKRDPKDILPISKKAMMELKKAQDEIDANVRKEIKKTEINIEPVPSIQKQLRGMHMGQEQGKSSQR